VPSLFRRNPADPANAADAVNAAEPTPEPADNGSVAGTGRSADGRPKGYTPSKKELGVATPKRSEAQRRRGAEPPPSNRREAAKRIRERQRTERAEAMAGMRAGEEKFLMPRDRGPERALVRDIVDSRRTAGTWFFVGALIVLLGSNGQMPPAVRLASNLVWVLLAVAVVLDSILISLKIKRLVRERFPRTTQRMRSLYIYGIMRSITFRRMRMPNPRVKLGEKV
jgi:hypothetical protein